LKRSKRFVLEKNSCKKLDNSCNFKVKYYKKLFVIGS
jgi:hypothetical protein